MRRARIPVAIALVLTLAGCASDSGPSRHDLLQQQVYSWIGHSESELIETVGPPNATAVLDDGARVLSWDLNRSEATPGVLFNGQYLPGPYVNVSCRLTYKVSGKKIVSAVMSSGC